MSNLLTPPDEPMVCGNCGEEHSESEAMIAHVGTHVTVIQPPDLDVLRERLFADVRRSLGTDPELGGTSSVPETIDAAMFHIEHLIADRFPPASQTEQITLDLNVLGADGGLDSLVALFAHSMDPLVEAIEGDPAQREPDQLVITITVSPRWTTGDAS